VREPGVQLKPRIAIRCHGMLCFHCGKASQACCKAQQRQSVVRRLQVLHIVSIFSGMEQRFLFRCDSACRIPLPGGFRKVALEVESFGS
jgi:hypothetical protein